MLEETLIERWKELFIRLGGREKEAEIVVKPLLNLYSPKHRSFHNTEHIEWCLNEFNQVRHLAENPDEVEFAIWYHDAIYNPGLEGNEEKSADLAQIMSNAIGLDEEIGKRVYSLVLATKHNGYYPSNDAKLLSDIDLISLGLDEYEFDKYSEEVRKEFSYVDYRKYLHGRISFAKTMLAKERIYQTDYFYKKYNQKARQNLERHLNDLERELNKQSNCNIMEIYGLNSVN